MKNNYLFRSERLGFRNWSKNDVTEFAKMNADSDVMEHFPKTLTQKETEELIVRLQKQFDENGYTYFVTEVLESGAFIGFIGLAFQEYKTDFTPAVDIGWRLKKSSWGNGYATEGATKCLEYGFQKLGLNTVIAVCNEKNTQSENVMKKIGMTKIGEFNHPKLKAYPEYQKCVCYSITKTV